MYLYCIYMSINAKLKKVVKEIYNITGQTLSICISCLDNHLNILYFINVSDEPPNIGQFLFKRRT